MGKATWPGRNLIGDNDTLTFYNSSTPGMLPLPTSFLANIYIYNNSPSESIARTDVQLENVSFFPLLSLHPIIHTKEFLLRSILSFDIRPPPPFLSAYITRNPSHTCIFLETRERNQEEEARRTIDEMRPGSPSSSPNVPLGIASIDFPRNEGRKTES